MSTLFWTLLGTGGVLWVVLKLLAGKIIGDEMRSRADDLPAVLLEFALRRLPPDLQDFYRPEWTDDMLAFNAEHERYPATKFVKSFNFATSLLICIRSVRAEAKAAYKQGKQDEANERLADQPADGVIDADIEDEDVTNGYLLKLSSGTVIPPTNVAELLAKNGSIGAPANMRRRRQLRAVNEQLKSYQEHIFQHYGSSD